MSNNLNPKKGQNGQKPAKKKFASVLCLFSLTKRHRKRQFRHTRRRDAFRPPSDHICNSKRQKNPKNGQKQIGQGPVLQKPYKNATRTQTARQSAEKSSMRTFKRPSSRLEATKNAKNGQKKLARVLCFKTLTKTQTQTQTRASAPHPGRTENGKRPEVTRLGRFVEP